MAVQCWLDDRLGVQHHPDAEKFQEHDEDAQTEIDVVGSLSRENRHWNTALAEGNDKYALVFKDEIGDWLMEVSHHQTKH
jgi:hypothetical protein